MRRMQHGNSAGYLTIFLLFAAPVNAQKMYWVDAGTNKIQRANLDGSVVEDRVTTGLQDPNDIALDLVNVPNKMYWTDHGTQTIRRANLDGSSIEDLVTNSLDGIVTPKGIAVDPAGGKIYWADSGTQLIQRANLDGTTVEDLYTNPADGLITPQGVALDITGGKIYWTDSGTDKIQRANMDGTSIAPEDLVTTGLVLPGSIALDLNAGKMYWMDSVLIKIQRANLDGTNVQDLAGPSQNDPFGLALDTAGGHLYWAESTPAIDRTNLDGSALTTLLTAELTDPRGMALDLTAACCTGVVCTVEDRQSCVDGGGYWLPGIADCTGSPCATGVCCLETATLVTCDDGGGGMDEGTCNGLSGTYEGGADCVSLPLACPTCLFEDEAHCKPPDGGSAITSDRTVGQRVADDFRAGGTGDINQVCWWPSYFNPGQGIECADPGQPPADNFIVRFFEDSGGLPGSELGPAGGQTVTVDAKSHLGGVSRVWRYSAPLSTPIPVIEGSCYWIEISGLGEGFNGCTVSWTTSNKGNGYSLLNYGTNYTADDLQAFDVAFCIDIGIDTANDCGVISGRCCACGGGCANTDLSGCVGADERFSPGASCPGCPADPANDDCTNATTLLDGATAFDNYCSTTDGFTNPCPVSGPEFEADVWFDYVASCSGTATVTLCNETNYDAMLAMYGPAVDCNDVCPVTDDADLLQCDDDACTGLGFGGASTVEATVIDGMCYKIRAGGFDGGFGIGEVDISCVNVPPCDLNPEPIAVEKNRTISFSPCDIGANTAVRVTTGSCPGEAWWVDVPDPVTGIAGLVSAPVYRDWFLDPAVIHVTDLEIIPGNSYNIQSIFEGLDTQNESFYSNALVVSTSIWGDVAGMFDGANWTPPNGVVNINDFFAVTSTFAASATQSLPLERVDLLPPVPDGAVSIADVLATLLAFQGNGYVASGGYLPCESCGVPSDCGGFTSFCDGDETCTGGFCRPGIEPCVAGESCDELTDQCDPATPLVTCTLSSPTVLPGGTVELTLSVKDISQLQGYQTSVEVNRTAGTGTLESTCPDGVYVITQTCTGNGAPCGPSPPFDATCNAGVDGICAANPDLPFLSPLVSANCEAGLASNVELASPVSVGGTPAYIATHELTATGAAAGSTFEISSDPGPATQLRDDSNDLIGFARGTPCTLTIIEADCNSNTFDDADDIANCPLNFANPVDCADCNSNVIPDGCDIASLFSADCNNNGVPDECEDFSIIYVREGAGGTNSGTSWDDAFLNLQDAFSLVACAAFGSAEVWVAAGTYHPDDGADVVEHDRTATFQLLDGTELYGGFNGLETAREQRNPAVNETILTGDLLGNDTLVPCVQDSPDCDSFGGFCAGDGFCIVKDNNDENSYHVTTGGGTDSTAILDGFTMTAGNADGGAFPDDTGAGMHNDGGSPTIRNCTFRRNAADNGGGINTIGGGTFISDCLFLRNRASFQGAGVFNNFSPTTIVRCEFTENYVAFANGGGIANATSDGTIVGCAFTGNSGSQGSAIANNASGPSIVNCLFTGNTAGEGAAISNSDASNPDIINCSFGNNEAFSAGAGIFNAGGTANNPTITNCVFWLNTDPGGNDESAQIHTVSGAPVVNYSIVQGGWTGAGGAGNGSSDPMFVDAVGGNLRIQLDSPATDAGNNSVVPVDSADFDGDGDTAETLPIDLDGNRRFANDLLTAGTGSGTPPIIDMGAYEIFRDCNFNGIPDDLDLGPGGAAVDCDSNGNPDECDISECEGDPDCSDCNNNGVPDACDIVSGTSTDCNGGGVPDECDIAACDPSMDPGCNDCNNNEVLDSCDIATATSLDVEPPGNPDGIPDECRAWDGAPDRSGGPHEMLGAGNDWSTVTNWQTDVIPGTTTAVVLNGNAVGGSLDADLDVPASVASLRLLNAATLNVDGLGGTENLTILTSNGLLVKGAIASNAPSNLVVGNDRIVDVPSGNLVIGPAGEIDSANDSTPATNSLEAVSIRIRNGSCECPPANGGALSINGTSIETTGDLILVPPIGAICSTICPAQRGGTTPPILTSINSAASIGGDLVMNAREGSGAPRGGTTPPILTTESSTFEVFGDFTMNDRAVSPPARGGTTPPILQMNLSDFIVHSDFLMDGRGGSGGGTSGLLFDATDSVITIDGNLTVLGPGSTLFGRGGTTPPILNLVNTAVTVGGDIILDGDVDVRGLAGRSTGPMMSSLFLGGNFINRSRAPEVFDWSNAPITMNGVAPQTVEMGAVDRGAGTTDFANNFFIGSLEIEATADVTFVDDFDNDGLGQSAAEVLYIDTLVIGSSATLRIDNTVVYYNMIQNDGAIEGTGAAIQLVPSPPEPCCLPGLTCVDLPAIDCTLAGGTLTGITCGGDPDGDGVPDGCDVCPGGDDNIDNNANGVPDACDAHTPLVPFTPHNRKKNRYVSFNPNNANSAVALQITLTASLNHPDALGTFMWVGAPDADGMALLSSTPVTRLWPEPVVIVTGCFISPVATYEVRASIDGGATFSAPRSVDTIDQPMGGKFWGDTVGSFSAGAGWSPPQGITNIDDAVAVIKTWQEEELAPHKSVTDIEPQFINRIVNINDVLFVIIAFQGDPYPFGCPADPCQDNTVIACP